MECDGAHIHLSVMPAGMTINQSNQCMSCWWHGWGEYVPSQTIYSIGKCKWNQAVCNSMARPLAWLPAHSFPPCTSWESLGLTTLPLTQMSHICYKPATGYRAFTAREHLVRTQPCYFKVDFYNARYVLACDYEDLWNVIGYTFTSLWCLLTWL